MKIALICSGSESLAVGYISACLKKAGHETYLFLNPALFRSNNLKNIFLSEIFDYERVILRKILELNPDLICFSVLTDHYGWSINMAKSLKKVSVIPIVFGGIHPTSLPSDVLASGVVDYVCVGEGEEAIVDLACVLEANNSVLNIPNIWSYCDGVIRQTPLRPLINDLDSLPFPDKGLFYRENKFFLETYSIVSSRGCLYKCSFCCHSFLKDLYSKNGAYLRRRSVDNVIAELICAKNTFGIKNVFFCDDLFLYDLNWVKEFSGKYKKNIDLPFACEAHPEQVSREIVKHVVMAGCVTVGMGMEEIDPKIKKDILNRYETREQVASAINIFKKFNIFLCVDVLCGVYGQNEDSFVDMALFFNKHKPDFIFPFWLRYYPKMKIVDIAHEQKWLSDQDKMQIEKDSAFSPFRGNPLNKKIAKMVNFLLISHLLPDGILNYTIRRRLYIWLPATNLFFLHFVAIFMTLFKSVVSGKKKMVFSSTGQIKYYLYYMFRKLCCFISS